MKYISVDIETTGTDPDKHSILEFAAVADDLKNPLPVDKLPVFRRFVLPNAGVDLVGNPIALAMNANAINLISAKTKKSNTPEEEELLSGAEFSKHEYLSKDFKDWLVGLGYPLEGFSKETVFLTVAGKNIASFDYQFMKRLPYWSKHFYVRHRMLDVGPLFLNPLEDEVIPDLDTCARRGGLDDMVTHEGLNEALMVVKLIRKHYKIKSVK